MERVLYNNSFDAVNMKLTVNDLVEVEKERIVAVWNVTKARAVMNRGDVVPDAISVSGNVITFTVDMVGGMDSSDKFVVVYDVPEVRSFVLFQNQTLTASGNSDVILAKYYNAVSLCWVVSSVRGTAPSLTVSIVGVDAFGNERSLVASGAINSVGTYWLDAGLGVFEKFKVKWDISGITPSFVVSAFVGLRM